MSLVCICLPHARQYISGRGGAAPERGPTGEAQRRTQRVVPTNGGKRQRSFPSTALRAGYRLRMTDCGSKNLG